MAARIQKEIKKLSKSPPPGISAWPADEKSLHKLHVQLQGPSDTPYEQGLFRLDVCVPQRYPFEPPKVQFVTKVYHPNIDAQGRICLDVLNMPPKGSWGPALDLCKVLIAVRCLLAEPNPKDPLVVDIAEECASQPELFKMKAKQHVAQHARPAGTQLQQHAAGPTVDQRQSCPAQVVGEQGRALLAGGDTCAAGAAVTETAAAAAAGTEVAAAAARSGGNSAGAGQTAAASNT